jgi:hypothetical protein
MIVSSLTVILELVIIHKPKHSFLTTEFNNPLIKSFIEKSSNRKLYVHYHWVSEKCDIHVKVKAKGKAIPLQALTDPGDSRKLRLPDFKTIDTLRWRGIQPYTPAAFTHRKYFWHSSLLELSRP